MVLASEPVGGISRATELPCLSHIGVKSLNRFVINWQAGAKLIRHVRQFNGFVTINTSAIKKPHDRFKGNSGLDWLPS